MVGVQSGNPRFSKRSPPFLCPLRPAPTHAHHTTHNTQQKYTQESGVWLSCVPCVLPVGWCRICPRRLWGVKGRQPAPGLADSTGAAAMVATHLRLVVSQTLTLHGILRAGSTDPCFSIREIDIKVPRQSPRPCATCPYGDHAARASQASDDGTRRRTHSWTCALCACACFVCVCVRSCCVATAVATRPRCPPPRVEAAARRRPAATAGVAPRAAVLLCRNRAVLPMRTNKPHA